MAILAGMMIAIGCVCYILVGGIGGAALFSIGLMTVCLYQLPLFTGQAGRLCEEKNFYKELPAIWLQNLIGVLIIVIIMFFSPRAQYDKIESAAKAIMQSREETGFIQSFFLAIPCGLLMTFAVRAPKAQPMRLFYIMGCVMAFILGGFYHCVADMFYTLTGAMNGKQFLNLFFVTAGNIVGCNIYPFINKNKWF